MVIKNESSNSDFSKFAKSQGITSSTLHKFSNLSTPNNMTRSVIEERQMNFREIDVFSRMMVDRIVFLGTGVDDNISNIIVAQMLYLDSVDSEKDITFYINSPGGSVMSGLAIHDTMNMVKSNVSTVGIGLAASMGAVLLSAGQKGKRFALPHTRVMIHQPLGGMSGQSTDMEISVNLIQELRKDLYTILSDASGKSYEQVEKDCDRDYWLRADAAKEYGLIDEVIKG